MGNVFSFNSHQETRGEETVTVKETMRNAVPLTERGRLIGHLTKPDEDEAFGTVVSDKPLYLGHCVVDG